MLIALLVAILSTVCRGDIFTAVADLQNLLGAEKEVTSVISAYIESELKRLEQLKKLASEYADRNAEAHSLGTSYITNPVNAYLLIKRLTSDWKFVESMMMQNSAEQFIKNITERRKNYDEVKYPQEEDLTGAAVALLRLQDTYKLNTHDLASGKIQGTSVGQQLSSHDCFEVGRAAYNQNDYYHTVLWMQEAQLRLENEDPPTAKIGDILEYLAFSLYKQGNVKRALALTKKLVRLEPDHPRAEGNLKWYMDMLEDNKDFAELPPLKLERIDEGTPERDSYEALCRGEQEVNITEQSKVYCYLKMDRMFLKLAPIKVEILRFDPLVVLFRQIISDYEIEIVEKLATPRLMRATVQNAKTGDLEYATYRISKSAWLKGTEHAVIDRINKRIDMMTNLNQETAEELQVANYGIGGHYDLHYDMSTKEETNAFKTLNTGNRIATVLIYMSVVESGGATVFNQLGTAVFPSKYDALFWYNLRRDGEGDLRTRHAACPVLTGIKWVSNKWIHERGQEFRRPCGLTPNAMERYVGDLTP